MSPAATKLAQAKATPAPSIMMLADENGQTKHVKAKAKPASKTKTATKNIRYIPYTATCHFMDPMYPTYPYVVDIHVSK